MKNLVNLFFLGSTLVFLILLARNPYSQRTLIPNLEPYPDTIHYIVPARSLISGGPFKIVREGRAINPSVPPAYSLLLTPFYLINRDPRTFYFANVFLSLLSLYFLFLIVRKFTENKWIIGFTLFLFASNYYMYWYPQWAMAENFFLPIFFVSLYLLVSPTNTKNIIFASLIPLLVYSTKYAYLPFAIIYPVLYSLKIFFEKKRRKTKNILIFLFLVVFLFAPILVYQSFMQGINPLLRYLNIFAGLFSLGGEAAASARDDFVGSSGWFSKVFFFKNFPLYIKGLLGERMRFLWDYTPILPRYIIYSALTGLVLGLFRKKYRFFSLSLLVLLFFHLFFVAAFSTFDMRYVYHAIPTLIIGFSLFLVLVNEMLGSKKLYPLFLLVLLLTGVYLFKNTQRLRYQTVLNLKYAEVPWYYISVLKLNDYFAVSEARRPYVISPMPPYYIDFYSNGNYKLLPLHKDQEFRLAKEAAWGKEDYSDFHKIYKKYLLQGYPLYVSTYGLGNEFYLHKAFDDLSKDFKLTEVQNECYTQCKIFKLELKNGKSI